MAKVPSVITRTCHPCGKKSRFKVKEVKKKPQSPLGHEARKKKRRGNRGHIGKYQKVPTKKVKKSKHPNLLLTCETCGTSKNLKRPRSVKFFVK